MIHTNRIVTVGEQESIIDRPIVLYRGDREVEIEFTLVGNEFMFSEDGNVIKSVNASHGQLVLNTPSGEHMFSELAECHEGKVVFVVTKEMIDEFVEVGFYSFQIRLYDSAEMKSRVTIPPVMTGFDIRNPIAAEDETNVVDQGLVDYSRIFKDQSNEELPTFDWTGAYNKTEWEHHDVITENKMNKIEDALYTINANGKESDLVMRNTLDQVKKDADKYVKEHIAEVEADIEEFERNLNTDVQKFKIDTNAAMTAHKNDVSEVVDGFSGRLVHNTNCLNNVFSFDNYGAVGDGVTDDTEAIKRCIAEASLISYSTIKSTPGKTYMISDTITVNTNMNIDLEGDMVYTGTNDRPAFVVGSTSKTLTLIKVNLSIYSKKYSDYSDFVLNGECDNMNIGVRLINIGQSEINIRNSKKFTVGVQCIATNSKGFYFNNLYINTHSNMCELEVTSLTKGWINGNKFKSITFQKSSGIKTTTDLYGILIHSRDNSYVFNSNWFGDVTSEGYGGNRAAGYRHYLVYLNHCAQHVIEFSRIENSTQDTFAYFGSGAEYCKVVKPPLLFTTSTAVEFSDTRTRSLNAVISYPGAYGTKCNNLIYDTGDLREDVYVTSSGHYASKKYYHTDFDSYKKMEYSKYPVTITSDRITWSSYSKPFMVIDTSEVKRIYYKAYNAVQSQEGVSFKFYCFFLDENDEVITFNNGTVLDDCVEYVNPPMYVPSTAPWFAQSSQNHYGSQVGTLTVTDKVKSVGIMFNNIIRFQLYADDVFTPIIREDYFKQGRIYVGRTGYQITESDTGVTLTKL